jgi:antitoxin Phd
MGMSTTPTERTATRSWRLQDAKARFSEVVRLAREAGPQRVTVRGKDAVVVVASDEFDRLRHPGTGADLVRAMADPRVRNLDFEHPKLRPPVRDVKL